jgi:predicted GIY-YIG superfamily endonuclease
MWCVYFLHLSNKDIYVGSTDNIDRRYQEHCDGFVISTKHYRPLKLIAYLTVATEKKARELEKYFKVGSGKAILKRRILTDEALRG